MIRFFVAIIFCFVSENIFSQVTNWKIVEGKITTKWSDDVDPIKPLTEYPRPQMVRELWANLNGLWDFTVQPVGDGKKPIFDEKILVPYPIESALSGVGITVGKDNVLWYKRTFIYPYAFRNKNVLLHFGAVDWRCEVWVNGKSAGKHEGGYDPFSFDITQLLTKSGEQEIMVSVWDATDEGPQPRGKQVKSPNSIWYTPVTGIWQTVWLEAVPPTYLKSFKLIPDIDAETITVNSNVINKQKGDQLSITILDEKKKIIDQQKIEDIASLKISNPKLWSPDSPFLYDVKLSILRKGKVIDEITTYFAMRKISQAPDQNGIQRILLNNQFVFQYGPLDQGWWPDGLYTAPTDEALKFDIVKTKEMGFNMIRKHVKVEPDRWYYHCDKLGMLVWQDMPSGDLGNRWDSRPGIIGIATEKERTKESEDAFKKEWKSIIDSKINFPSIVVWVPFNEAWGQFKTKEIVEWTMSYDTTRLVNAASGGNFYDVGHIMDLHNYPDPSMPDPKIFGKSQSIVLGEFGGLGLPLEGHTWQGKDNWGYQSFPSKDELWSKYESLIKRFPALIEAGLSAAVYTQTTDVEIEVNGLMTYDRKVIKMPESKLKDVHSILYENK
jgi:beta-galactosidase/beta-glucuronidase